MIVVIVTTGFDAKMAFWRHRTRPLVWRISRELRGVAREKLQEIADEYEQHYNSLNWWSKGIHNLRFFSDDKYSGNLRYRITKDILDGKYELENEEDLAEEERKYRERFYFPY